MAVTVPGPSAASAYFGRLDDKAWNRARQAGTRAVVEQYRHDRPKGRWLAQVPALLDDVAWREATEKDDVAAYERYLRLAPHGKRQDEARNRRNALRRRDEPPVKSDSEVAKAAPEAAPVAAQPPGTERRYLRLRVDKGTIFAGDIPLILPSFTAQGKEPPCGGTICLSGDITNTTLDVTALSPNRTFVVLGTQTGKHGRTEAIASARIHNLSRLSIDKQGLASPDEAKQVVRGSSYIGLTFISPDDKPIASGSLLVSVSSRSKDRHVTNVNADGTLSVSGVKREPLRIHLREKASRRREVRHLFPMFRGATEGVILYTVVVRLGTPAPSEASSAAAD